MTEVPEMPYWIVLAPLLLSLILPPTPAIEEWHNPLTDIIFGALAAACKK